MDMDMCAKKHMRHLTKKEAAQYGFPKTQQQRKKMTVDELKDRIERLEDEVEKLVAKQNATD